MSDINACSRHSGIIVVVVGLARQQQQNNNKIEMRNGAALSRNSHRLKYYFIFIHSTVVSQSLQFLLHLLSQEMHLSRFDRLEYALKPNHKGS